jgi:regulator of protease activity HflC (stomatin/prohibitin superfamily)
VGLVVSALIIPGQISKAREASEREQARQQAKQSAAAAEESNRAEALANAEKYVAEFEAQYCQLLNSALKDSEFRRFISNEANDMSEADEDVVKEKYYVGLVEIYTKYTSLGVTLGADRANFVSPVLELHIGSYGLSNDSTNIIAQCSAY